MTRRRRCSASRHVLERQRAAQARDVQRAREVAVALVARLQQVEQLGGDLVAAAPVHRARARRRRRAGRSRGRARAARSGAGGRRSGRARRRRCRPAGRRGGRSRRARSRAARGGRGRARARGRSAARRAAAAAGGSAALVTASPSARSCASRLALELGQRSRRRARVSARSTRSASRSPELPRQRHGELGGRRAGDRRVQPERQGGPPAHRCVSVAAAHVPTSAELILGRPGWERLLGDPNKFRRRGSDYASMCRPGRLPVVGKRS